MFRAIKQGIFLFLCVYALGFAATAQFAGFVNHGLVGVGRLSPALFDAAGDGRQDTLGGFSAMAVVASSLTYQGEKISGTLVGLPDRGFGDGANDYHPRLEEFQFSIIPYYGSAPVGQNQILFTNTATRRLVDRAGNLFTGFDAGTTSNTGFPRSASNSLGRGAFSLDPEGLALRADGSYWISDEYGPFLCLFDAQERLQKTFLPPAAIMPRMGPFPGLRHFTATNAPASGRRNNRGFEGLSLTPDGKRLIAGLQSPIVQDGGLTNTSRHTRIVHFDADASSPTFGNVLAEHVYQLTLNGSAARDRHTPISEILALNSTTFLVLERDSNGLGSGTNIPPIYKRIVLVSTQGATNIEGTGYDLEKDAPGQRSLPIGDLPGDVRPVARKDFIDLLNGAELAKFGLNTNVVHDRDTLSEKWEALALVPLKDAARPNDFLLLVGNDNDFKAPVVFHNGRAIGTNQIAVDIMLLAYRVTLPGFGRP